MNSILNEIKLRSRAAVVYGPSSSRLIPSSCDPIYHFLRRKEERESLKRKKKKTPIARIDVNLVLFIT